MLRSRRGWSQPVLAAKCQLAGWDVSRDIIARIELRVRWVADFELSQSTGQTLHFAIA